MRGEKPLVAFDVDGVLTDFTLAFTTLGKEVTGHGVAKGQRVQQTWSYGNDPATPSFTPEDEAKTWEEIRRSRTFWYDQPSLLIHADLLAMDRLAESHDIVYVTDRSAGVGPLGQTIAWLSEEGVPFPSNVMCRGVTGMSKVETVAQLKAVAVLEDSPANLKELILWTREGRHLYKMLYPYNVDCPGMPVHSVEAYCFAVLGEEVWK